MKGDYPIPYEGMFPRGIPDHPAHVTANTKQIGGKHYKQFQYQPWDVVTDWGLGYLDGTALKYIARWKDKNGLEDIKKAIHFLEKLIEVEGNENGSR